MTGVVVPGHHSGHSNTIASISGTAGPVITMVPNSDFTFPIQPRAPADRRSNNFDDPSRRPASASMHIDIPRADVANAHRRTASTLPAFTFNASDTSGRADDETPPHTPEETTPVTPVRRGHRRGGSEFVGGDSRLGVSNALSSSPTKVTAPLEAGVLSTGPPSDRRGHSHRRSAAISSHDISRLMQPATEPQPRLSCSLPTTPLEHPAEATAAVKGSNSSIELDRDISDPFGGPLDNTAARPPSRPRVGFSDNVEFIPRPLSTISSETESSISTVRGHSVNNSISSVLSLSSPSPPSTRTLRTPLSTTQEDEPGRTSKSSMEISKHLEREGQWLKRRSSDSLKRPMSESAITHPKTTFVEPDPSARPKRRALSHALGLDRRRSEPVMGINPSEPSRLSTISLQEPSSEIYNTENAQDTQICEPKSSARRIRDWAASKITKRTRDANRAGNINTSSTRAGSAGNVSVPGQVPSVEVPVAEMDLDAVFSSQNVPEDTQRPLTPAQPRIEINIPPASQYSTVCSRDSDESEAVLDLDAALGPFKTPPIGPHKQRKELHSSRLTKDFVGPGGHYHRRSESEPLLPPFEICNQVKRPQSEMLDVFEEDEEDAVDVTPAQRQSSTYSAQEGETDSLAQSMDFSAPRNATTHKSGSTDSLGLRGDWEPERPPSSHASNRSMLSGIVLEGRGSSIMEETIMEEPGFGDDVEIVEADEEPRASSQTKSSDSSETPTVLAAPINMLTVPDGQHSLMTPETYQTSTFSSPAMRPGSFDTNRLDTAASSIAENRTISSCTTGDLGHDLRISVDVPSLTSSRSTMISSVPGNNSHRDFGNTDRTMSVASYTVDSVAASERRRKRGSIQSLSQLVGGPFGAKSRGISDARPQSSSESDTVKAPKKEHRLKKLMFWKSKHTSNQSLQRGS